ncbi:MAG: 50S ribosomal protein L35 [Chloroflexia bacterium]|nr:50S ribosomal protein L35 [Chloroflexia bacterium]
MGKKKKKYKLKTHRGAKKRFKVTARGKVLRMKGRRSHLRRKKAPRVRREFRTMLPLSSSDRKRVQQAMPGLGKSKGEDDRKE